MLLSQDLKKDRNIHTFKTLVSQQTEYDSVASVVQPGQNGSHLRFFHNYEVKKSLFVNDS